ncbi:MAG: IS66 family transposase, partial [Planctomycetota bacterium]
MEIGLGEIGLIRFVGCTMEGATATAAPTIDDAFIDRFCLGKATEQDARRLASGDAETCTFTLLAIQQRLAGRQAGGPNTPSGSKPPYQKPGPKPRGKPGKKRGGQKGHPGSRRKPPIEADQTRDWVPESCPDCGQKLQDTGEVRERLTEDIPEDLKPVVTRDRLHRGVCPRCRKRFEGKPPDVLPRCQLGNRTLVLSAMLHFLQGLTLSQITETFNFHLQLKLSAGGLVQMWHRLAEILFAWYQEIQEESLSAAKLHADETGWRVQGKTHWLWCFASDAAVYYLIDRSRGSPALQKFFTREFEGTLVSDFWSPYDSVLCTDQQKCWPHLLRDVASVDEKHRGDSDWDSFRRRLMRAYKDAKKLHSQKPSMHEEPYDAAVVRLEGRLASMGAESWDHSDAKRLAKRLAKYGNELLTFLWYDDVPSSNNAGERAIRPAVMIRKNSYA